MARTPERLKIAFIGAGSGSFASLTIADVMLSETLNSVPLELVLMDIAEEPLRKREAYTNELARGLGRNVRVIATTRLEEAVDGADFVITAIEARRQHYWTQDFHVPRRYGFRQIFGENGGPGAMFHTLRSLPALLEIARTMERLCPNAWMINYSNPEAKLVEGISKLSNIKVVGLCHGIGMGIDQLSRFLEMPTEDLDVTACGMNHFSWFQKIANRHTGEDLYPELIRREKEMNWLSDWDEIALSRIMLRTYGLYPLPGANHIGEYLAWGDGFLASSHIQFFYDPVEGNPWKTGNMPKFVYSFSSDPTSVPLFGSEQNDHSSEIIDFNKLKASHEVGIPMIEAIAFDRKTDIKAVNVPNRGMIPGLYEDMVVELPAYVDGEGIHTRPMEALPAVITEMIRVQGTIHKLVIEAYAEQSRRKLLQALLIDPTVSSYHNAVALIDEMCELQKEILPPMHW